MHVVVPGRMAKSFGINDLDFAVAGTVCLGEAVT
jgi:hypothetical protein